MQAFMIVTALAALLSAFSTPVLAADLPKPVDCVAAYTSLDVTRSEALSSGSPWVGMFMSGAERMDFETRKNSLLQKFKPSGFDVATIANPLRKAMKEESLLARVSGSLSSQSIFSHQIAGVTLARACDQAYGFSPVLDAPPAPEVVLKHFTDLFAREDSDKAAHSKSLDDLGCSVRFMTAAGFSAGIAPVQQAMTQRAQAAAMRHMRATPGLTQEQTATMINRGVQELAAKLKGDEGRRVLMEDLNKCEARYGLPLTKAN